ncbi:hypothetical protein LRP30_31530 [Bradyrhizobium sp. C-145]|nr:hypothetical protein [Bradyrhizobium sp. C-145]UQR61426.1 hypothetical protein LRP30_31530 [Bradyrhizobium sp. C-145]
MNGSKEIAIAKSGRAYLKVIALLAEGGKQMTCAAEPFGLLSWGGVS